MKEKEMAILRIENAGGRGESEKQTCIELLNSNGVGHKVLYDGQRDRILVQVPDEVAITEIEDQLPENVKVIKDANWNWLWKEGE